MRTHLFHIGVLSLAGLVGCEFMPARVSQRFASVPPQEREIEATRSAVFHALPVALKKMGFLPTRVLEAQGIVVARSSIRSDDAFREARQYEFEINLREFGSDQTKISVILREQIEGELKAGTTNQALRSHGLYDSFFAMLEQALAEQTGSADHVVK